MHSDVIVIGAGAAGMMCAARAAAASLQVQLLDHASKLGEKIRISGGGRCNFTNRQVEWHNYVSNNPRFARYALTRYTSDDFLSLVESYGIGWHEKHKGQLFCDESARDIIAMLRQECDKHGVRWRMPCAVKGVSSVSDESSSARFMVETDQGRLSCDHLVIATGGLALPAVGASDFGLRLAQQFGLAVVPPRPALVPLVFDLQTWQPYAALAGVSIAVSVASSPAKKAQRFVEDILFTHRGLSGPGILQISSYWDGQSPISLNLNYEAPHQEAVFNWLLEQKQGSRQQLSTVLAQRLPKRLAQLWPAQLGLDGEKRIAELSDKALRQIAQSLTQWQITPSGTAGYKKAEAMRGGVDTAELEPTTMQSKAVAGLYFIGEVVDITGWLGGYNFQWAWSSAVVCAEAIAT